MTNPTEPEVDPFLVLDGATIELTDPEQPTDAHQPYDAVVLEPVRKLSMFVELWLAAPRENDNRPYAAPTDSETALLSPDEADALGFALIARAAALRTARADLIDPPTNPERT